MTPALGWGQTETVSTMGRDFWVGFMENFNPAPELTLLVSGPIECYGTVQGQTPNGQFSQMFHVVPGSVTSVSVPASFATSDYGLHITAGSKVSLYAANFDPASYDVTGVLPTMALGNNYVLQSYAGGYGNTFCVVATQDSTQVYHKPRGGATSSTLLMRGEKLYVEPNADLAGTRVWTAGCKPVAVFAGNVCANIPATANYCDHIYEQAVPTRYWGRHFVVTASMQRTHDRVRVTALKDSTTLQAGEHQFLLQAGESYEFDLEGGTTPVLYMESNRPVCVFLYLTGATYGGGMGDPSFCIIHPIEQQMASATFATFNTDRTQYHYLNIAVDSGTVGHLMLDGTTLSPGQFLPVTGHPEYAYARVPLTNGSHTLRAASGGFNAQVYGLGDAESYAYAAGANLELVNARVWLDDVAVMEADSNRHYCPGDTLHFRARVVNPEATTIIWGFGDGTVAEGKSVTKSYSQSGEYEVSVSFVIWDSCMGFHEETLHTMVTVDAITEYLTDTMVCGDSCVWRGQTYRDTGSYSYRTESPTSHCGVRHTLNLNGLMVPAVPEITSALDCETQELTLTATGGNGHYVWHATPPDRELVGQEHEQTIVVSMAQEHDYEVFSHYDFDSLCGAKATYHATAMRPFIAHAVAEPEVVDADHSSVVLRDLSAASAGRSWYLDGSMWGSDQEMTINYPMDCDSVLVVMDAYNIQHCHDSDTLWLRLKKEMLWIPNIFTPNSNDNNRFVVQGTNVASYAIWIYNREGLLVFESRDMQEHWDGCAAGVPVPQGSYVYTIIYTTRFEPNRKHRVSGTVTLVR